MADKPIEQMSADELRETHRKTLADVTAIYERVGDNAPSKEDKEAAIKLNHTLEDVERAMKEHSEWAASRAGTAERTKAANTPAYPVPFPGGTGGQAANRRTPGDVVLSDAGFKAWREAVAPHIGAGGSLPLGLSPRVTFEGIGVKTLITGDSSTSAGALIVNDRQPLVDLPFRMFTIRDLITIGETTSDTVDYPYVASRTNAAAPTPEATSTSGGVGAAPESGLVLAVGSMPVKTITHDIPATRQALADAGIMRTLINSLLTNGAIEEWEDQVVAGDGTGDNITGMEHFSGIQTQAFSTSKIITARKARTLVKTGTAKATATAFLMNPTDWEAFDLAVDNEQRYYFGGPAVLGNPRLWGLPVVESEAKTAGDILVGDFKQVIWFDRQLIQILVSDQHMDFFKKRMLLFLAEMRGALIVWNAQALVKASLS